MDAIAVVILLAYFGFAAYNGQAGPAAKATWTYGVQGAGFMAGAAVIWGLWQVRGWREPVAIFTAIIVLAFLLNSYANIGNDIQQVMAVLPNLTGKFNWNAGAQTSAVSATTPATTPAGSSMGGYSPLGGGYPSLANNLDYMSSLPASDQGFGAWLSSQFSGYMPSGLPNYSTIQSLDNQAIGNIQGGAAGL
jgi:hypothetical protein